VYVLHNLCRWEVKLWLGTVWQEVGMQSKSITSVWIRLVRWCELTLPGCSFWKRRSETLLKISELIKGKFAAARTLVHLYSNRRKKLSVKNTPLGIHLWHLPHSHCTTCRTVQTERRKACGAESGGGSHRESSQLFSLVGVVTLLCVFFVKDWAQYQYDML
jgi:hypothetical protein